MNRPYQYRFSVTDAGTYDDAGRLRKARTLLAVMENYYTGNFGGLTVLDVGASVGVIDNYLADFFSSVVGIDIDDIAIHEANRRFNKPNLKLFLGDAMRLGFADNVFDIVVCSHVYEHVPSAERMMEEVFRVLRPGGVCYFAAGNRLMWTEPHYHLPLLSVIPRVLGHAYVRLAGRAQFYHELHYSYWGLRKLVSPFRLHDYTRAVIEDPDKYCADYMLQPGTLKNWVAKRLARWCSWLVPSYIWVLEKPDPGGPTTHAE